MPMLLSLVLAILGTAGFLAATYFGVLFFFGARNRHARPAMQLLPGGVPGTLGVSVLWDPEVYAVQIWRIRFRFFSPARLVKDSQFTVTFESPMKSSFFVPIELPGLFKELVEGNNRQNRAVITVEARGVENFVMAKDFRLPRLQKIYHGAPKSFGPRVAVQALAKEDAAAVTSLDYSELVVRKDRLRSLAAAAKAKIKPVPPKPVEPLVEAKP